MLLLCFFFYGYGDHRDLHVLTHSFPTRRSSDLRSIPCPSYPEIRLAFAGRRAVGRRIRAFAPQAIHISTEGPLGLAARRWCLDNGFPFTTAYHTRFPEYVAAQLPVSPAFVWRFIRWFHRPARPVMVATRSPAREQIGRAHV